MAKPTPAKPTLAVWKFASCDGCQLSVLDLEDELLALAGKVTVANFAEASTAVIEGPYDISLVEGSVTTPEDEERIHRVRTQSRILVTIGACATAGGIQALRNFADVGRYASVVYAHPEYLSTLATSTPIADHVRVDYELRGCPVSKRQLVDMFSAYLRKARPPLRHHSVCEDCKAAANVCVLVAHGTPCLGPVTSTGCEALCPGYSRGCFGCYGPMESPNTTAMTEKLIELGMSSRDVARVYQTFNAGNPVFHKAAQEVAG